MTRNVVRSRNLIAWFALLLIGLLWGATIPLTRVAVSTGHQPFGLIFWQLIIMILTLGPYLAIKGWRPRINGQVLVFYVVVALAGTIIPNGFSYIAAAQLPAGVMAIAIATVPLFSLAIALIVQIESFALRRVTGVAIGFLAMVMIAAPETSLPDPEKAVFVLVALIAPFFYGMESNFIATRTPPSTDPVSTLFMASVLGLAIVAPLTFASGQWIDPRNTWHAPELALIASSIVHAVTYVGYIWLIKYGGPVFSVQVAYPVTLSGVFFSILFLGEGYSGWIWTALILVIVALFLVQPKLEDLKEQNFNA